MTPQTPKKRSSERLRELWPDIRELIRPRRGVLALGFLLMAIGTPCGLVLPASTKYLIDDVIGKKHDSSAAAAGAGCHGCHHDPGHHVVRAHATGFESRAASDRRAARKRCRRTSAHLPVSYYDANKTGTLVSRIMNDVEGIRNLLGTGLIEFVGGVLTAVLVLVISALPELAADGRSRSRS